MTVHFSLLCQKCQLYYKTKIYQHLLNNNNGYNILLVCNTTSIFHIAIKNLQKESEGIVYFKHLP